MTSNAAVALPDPLDRTLTALADALSMSPSVMSRHLKVLRDSEVVEEASPGFDARVRIYSLRSGATAALRSWLDAVEQGWAEQLAALKAHVEGGG